MVVESLLKTQSKIPLDTWQESVAGGQKQIYV